MSEKRTIGIIGLGIVGEPIKIYFEKQGRDIFIYDKFKNFGSLEEANKGDIIFICVPTPFKKDSGFDDSAIEENLKNITGNKIIVIKSTILPGSTEKYQKEYPQHKMLFNPEFLREKYHIEDFLNPERQIVGYTQKSKDVAQDVLEILPKAPFKKIIPAQEAEMVKYFGNAFLALRVVFANQIYDLCQKLGLDYEIIKGCAGADSRIGTSHFNILQDGYRGYSGKCLPKDVRALIQFAQNSDVDFSLLKLAEEINNKLCAQKF